MDFIALIFTLVVGLFMLLGSVIAFIFKDNKKIVTFSLGTSFSLMSILIILDLVPEVIEEFGSSDNLVISYLLFISLAFLGGLILKLLDHFIPHHHGDHCHDEHEEESHLFHIGLMTMLAITLHNIIEGMAIYGVFATSISSGMIFATGIILHNIPLGMTVTAALYKATESYKKSILYVLLMAIGTFLGGLIMVPLSATIIGDLSLQILLSMTVGMISYIILFEFLPVVIEKIKDKAMIMGIIVGIIIAIISSL